MKTLIIFSSFALIILMEASAQDFGLKRGKYKTWYKLSSPPCKEKGITFSVTDTSITLVRSMYYKPNTNLTDYDYLIIPSERIETFKARRKGNMAIGAAIGALAGAGIGLLIGYTQTEKGDDYRGVAIGSVTLLSGVFGIFLGTAISSAKIIIPISSNRDTFVKEKSRLEKYSAKKF